MKNTVTHALKESGKKIDTKKLNQFANDTFSIEKEILKVKNWEISNLNNLFVIK